MKLENDEIYDDDEWLVFMQLNKINPLLDELMIFNLQQK